MTTTAARRVRTSKLQQILERLQASSDTSDRYVVEKIITHDFTEDGTLIYQVKWQGFEKVADRTWEPEANLEGLNALEEYKKDNGVTVKPKPKGRGKRKSTAMEETPVSTPQSTISKRGNKRAKLNGLAQLEKGEAEPGPRKLPEGSWEEHVLAIDTIEEVPYVDKLKNAARKLAAYIVWDDGRKSQHPLTLIRQKCPQRLLDYYEEHLYVDGKKYSSDTDADSRSVFKTSSEYAEGTAVDDMEE